MNAPHSSRATLTTIGLGLALASIMACSSEHADPSTSDSPLVETSSADITVLKASAFSPGGAPTQPQVPGPDCAAIDASSADCTARFEERAQAPALHDVVLPGISDRCGTLIVTTATRKAALASSVGIGFFYSGAGGEGRFVEVSKLKTVGEATLKDGETVVLHEFVGRANCWLGSATSSQRASYTFKPYLEFRAGGETYRNWDRSEDYSVSLLNGFVDRSQELLR